MTKKEIIDYLSATENGAVHSKNFLSKLKNDFGAPNSFKSQKILDDFFIKYKSFRENILSKINDVENNIEYIVNELNVYKDYVNKHNPFTSQSKFESTILEEFIFYILKDFIINEKINCGSVNAYCNLYFSPQNLKSFIDNPSIKIHTKDQDFSIYRSININAEEMNFSLQIPIIAIECKTYIDKTMLEGSIATAEKVKTGNPHAKFFIVTETYEIDYGVDISFSRIDQIFVLRKQKRRNKSLNPIFPDVILSLYRATKAHLNANWIDTENKITQIGQVI